MKNLKKEFLTKFIIGAVLLSGIVIVFNMIWNNLQIGRFDLTADQVYKLSPSVKKILTNLDAPIDLTYYVSSSEKMPTQWKNLERDVIDKLKEIKLASNGMLNYTVFDPSAEEEKEAYEESKGQDEEDVFQSKPKITRKKIAERLYEKGVIPFGVQSTERDEFAVKRVYSSIVLSYLDRKEDVFYPSQPEIPPQQRQYNRQGPPPDMYEFAAKLLRENGYDVTRTNIKEDDPIPKDIQTMVLMIDQPLSERQMYEIDKLVHQGVRIIIGGQQNNYQISPSRTPGEFDLRGMPSRLNINTLTKNYGFEFDDKMFMDQSAAYIQVPTYQTRKMGMFQIQQQRMEPVTKPVLIRVNAGNINSKLSISNKIREIFYIYGGRLLVHDNILKDSQLTSNTLFTSSNVSWTRSGYGYGAVDVSPPPQENILRYQPLSIFIKGKFKPMYADQNIPKWPAEPGKDTESFEEEEMPSEIVGDSKENMIIAFGCTNIFKSDVLQSVSSHNALLLNSVDALTLGEELINIRSKNIVARRLKDTSSVEKAIVKAVVVWVVPVLFVALGFYLNIRRRKN